MIKIWYKADGEITLWCVGCSAKSSSRTGQKWKAEDPEVIQSTKEDTIDQLAHEKHGEAYTMPQYGITICGLACYSTSRIYKNMDVAPPYPPFQNRAPKTPKRENQTDALTSAATAVVNVLSGKDPCGPSMAPGKRAHVSGQYLEHLERLKSLHDSSVLFSEDVCGTEKICIGQYQNDKFTMNSSRNMYIQVYLLSLCM